METKASIFAHVAKSAELIEKTCSWFRSEGCILRLLLASCVKPPGWANRVDVSLPDVCAADWRARAVLFANRINYYLMHVKRQNA